VNNSGYASIRTSQINYFNGNYIGCDAKTGLGFPSWELLAEAYNLRYCKIDTFSLTSGKWLEFFNDGNATVFELIASPHQIYEPRITSYIRDDGSMNSNPIHLMTPPLDEAKSEVVFKYFKSG
jgi:acetolactate synthase-1/2/3 large subunit